MPNLTTRTGEASTLEGRWKIKDSALIYYDMRSNNPDFPVDAVTDPIVAAGKDYLVYRASEGVLMLMRKTSADPENAR
jgi:hypothetical protein